MKKLLATTFILGSALVLVGPANAQMPALNGVEGMGGFSNSSADWNKVVEHTLREEKEGKELWDKFSRSQDRGSSTESGQAKKIACADFSDEQFRVLGEYFMGQMMGDSHAAMNAMMIQVHGEEGEEQVHIVMGKRLSGCDTSVVAPGISGGWMPMMNMMTGGWMKFGFWPFGGRGWVFVILWWVLIIAGIVTLVRWVAGQSRGGVSGGSTGLTAGKSALDILKERYAKGEIDKKDFEKRYREIKSL